MKSYGIQQKAMRQMRGPVTNPSRILRLDTDVAANWTASSDSCTIASDTTKVISSGALTPAGVKLTHVADKASFEANLSMVGATKDISAAKYMICRYYVHPGEGTANPLQFVSMGLTLRSGGGDWLNYSQVGIIDRSFFAADTDGSGWYTTKVTMGDLNVLGGTLDLAAIDYARIGIGDSADSNTCAITISEIAFYGADRAVPLHCLMFDDGSNANYGHAAYLTSLGLRATFYVVSDRVGTSGYMTLAQLHEISSVGGHLIANHSADHIALTTAGVAGSLRAMLKCARWMEDNGFGAGARHYAVPQGTSESSRAQYEAMRPYLDSYRITASPNRAIRGDGSGYLDNHTVAETSAATIAVVDRGIAYGVDTSVLVHQTSITTMKDYFDYLLTKHLAGEIRVATVDELVRAD